MRDPALDGGLGGVLVGRFQEHVGAAPAVAHHLPAIGGRLGLVHDDDGRSALAGGFLILVGPAAVIGHRLALEEFWIGRLVLVAGIVDQHDHGLSLHVQAGIVVPAIFRRHHAIAHEHDLRAGDVGLGLVEPRREIGDVGAQLQRQCALGGLERRIGGLLVQGDGNGRHLLEIAAMVGGLDADALEFVRDPLCCDLAVLGAGATAFKSVVSHRLVARRQVGSGDVGRCGGVAGISRQGGGGQHYSGGKDSTGKALHGMVLG